MKANVGFLDMFIRIFLGVVAIGMGISGVFPGQWNLIVGIIGIVPLATGLMKFCPLYTLFGINTKGADTDSAH